MTHIITPSMDKLAHQMKRFAERGLFDGQTMTPYFNRARQFHEETGTMLLYTRESGYHSSGWWKNPDYERCYHLSISFWDVEAEIPRPFEPGLSRTWASAFFGAWTRYIWEESSVTHKLRPGSADVHHYRVFCDVMWKPIIPRGEVYTKEFIEEGWKSWSDVQYEKQQAK